MSRRVLAHPKKPMAPHMRPKASSGFDFPVTLVGKTPDGRVSVYYDPSTGPSGLANARSLLAWAPQIVAWHDTTFGYAGRSHNVILASLSGSTDGSDGAYHYGCDFASGGDLYVDVAFGNSPLVAGLYAAELSECYMGGGPNATPWGCGYSNGEGLSRRCADEIVALLGFPKAMDDFSAASSWNTDDDWVTKTENTDGNYDSIGCALVAIDYLVARGFSLARVAQAPGDTLEAAYKFLTGLGGFYGVLKSAVASIGVVTNDFPFTGGPSSGPAPATTTAAPTTSAPTTPAPKPPAPPPPPPPPPPPVPVPQPPTGGGLLETFVAVWNGLRAAGVSEFRIIRDVPQILHDIARGESAEEILSELLSHSQGRFGFLGSGTLLDRVRERIAEHIAASGKADLATARKWVGTIGHGQLIAWLVKYGPFLYAIAQLIAGMFGIPLPPLPSPLPTPPSVRGGGTILCDP